MQTSIKLNLQVCKKYSCLIRTRRERSITSSKSVSTPEFNYFTIYDDDDDDNDSLLKISCQLQFLAY